MNNPAAEGDGMNSRDMASHNANLVAAVGYGNVNPATVSAAAVSILFHLLVAAMHNRDAAQYAVFFILYMLYGPTGSTVPVATRDAIMDAIKLPTSHWNTCVTKFRRAFPRYDPSHPALYVGRGVQMVVDIPEIFDRCMAPDILQTAPALAQSLNAAQRANEQLMRTSMINSTAGLGNFARQWDRPEAERYRAAAQVMENVGRGDEPFAGERRNKKRQRR